MYKLVIIKFEYFNICILINKFYFSKLLNETFVSDT